jgi:hypothetical protein
MSRIRLILLLTFALLAAGPAVASAGTLNISMQVQQQTNWCWAAGGNTVAAFYGHTYSQNQFCNMAFGRSMNSTCPNDQATLANDQQAFGQIGISRGSYITGTLSYNTVVSEINANRPMMSRIQWSSGGGHMLVVYGYNPDNGFVYWGDPWPDDYRYNWAAYNYYVSNNSFRWTHSLYRIGA